MAALRMSAIRSEAGAPLMAGMCQNQPKNRPDNPEPPLSWPPTIQGGVDHVMVYNGSAGLEESRAEGGYYAEALTPRRWPSYPGRRRLLFDPFPGRGR